MWDGPAGLDSALTLPSWLSQAVTILQLLGNLPLDMQS